MELEASPDEGNTALVESDSDDTASGGLEYGEHGLQLSGSMTSEEDEDDVEADFASEMSSEISSYSIGELHSAVVLAPFDEEDTGEDDLCEQLSSVSSSDVNTVPYGEDPVLTKQELIRQIHLRRHVDQLKRNLASNEARVQQVREQLDRCCEQISDLNAQQLSLAAQITHHQEEGNMASVGLLKTQLNRVTVEITAEEQVKANLEDQLKEAELKLCEAHISAGQLDELEAGLVKGEELVHTFKEKRAAERLKTEGRLLGNMERSQRTMEKQFESRSEDHEEQTKSAIEKARKAHEKGKQFLRKTLERRRKEEALAGKKHQQHLEKRMQAILSLKHNIDASQSTIQALQMLREEESKKMKESEKKERNRIIAEGGNPEEVFLKRQRASQFEREKQKFKEKQDQRQLEIVMRLLEEDKIKKRLRKEDSKSHWHGRQKTRPHPSKRNLIEKKKRKNEAVDESKGADEEREETEMEVRFDEEANVGKPAGKESSSDEEFGVDKMDAFATLDPLDMESVLEPEIKGLWETAPLVKKESVHTGEGGGVKKEKSKMELEMMKRAMDKLKKSAIIKQVAGGKEFKGQAFLSKPEEVVFSDFEVGKVYRKKLQLTNVSYSINYCRLVGASDNLKDFLKIDFNPPGSMSAGLTCHMTVTFQPKLNEDLIGNIEMASQTGYFSIPVKCLSKKCLVTADKTSVEFGGICLGETVRRRITLRNEGAIPTNFRITDKLSQPLDVPSLKVMGGASEDGRGVATQQSAGPLADKSAQSIMSNVEVPPSRVKKLVSGLGIGLTDSESSELKSRSVGNLSSMSVKSLGISPSKEDDDKGEDPSNQEGDMDKAESTAVLQQKSAIQIGRVSEGEVPGFGSRCVELVFSPEDATEHIREFFITFSHPDLQPIRIDVSGRGLDLPVFVDRDEMDLRTCMLEQLYQDSVVLHNRAATPFRVTFEVPVELQSHLEVVPKHGLVQGQSSFAAQVKFLPLPSILESSDCNQFFDEGSGTYSMPIHVQVADQTRPVVFSVLATVTTSDLSFSLESLDFGSCTVHESVVLSLEITNNSLLPQKFGFVHLPPCVEVQPNDGFGQLLPHETLPVDVIFSASKPKEYSFELTCKTGIDRTFKLPCLAIGVLPALELSENVVNFAATPINGSSSASITVRNPRLSRLNSAVIRGAVLAQGPKMFEFAVPEGSSFTVCPSVASVGLGESVTVQVEFSPKLKDSSIEEEAKRLAEERLLEEQKQREKALAEEQAKEATSPVPAGKKKGKKAASKEGERQVKGGLLSTSKGSLSSGSKSQVTSLSKISAEVPAVNSDLWWKAYHNLLEKFENYCVQLSIACFVSSPGTSTDTKTTPAYRPEDTLYLEVTGPVIRPGLLVVSDHGRTALEFDSVGCGDLATKTVTVKNISSDSFQLRASLLDPHGPFEVRNSLRSISPGETRNVVVRFSPSLSGKYYEPLKLFYGEAKSLKLKLTGVAIEPKVSLSPKLDEEDGGSVLKLGPAVANDTVTRTIQLHNDCSLCVRFEVQQESLLPKPLQKKRPNSFRANNYRAPPPFDCKPVLGVIDPNATKELVVSFTPDHQSQSYADTIEIKLNGQTAYSFDIVGQAWANNMYSILGHRTQLEADEYKKDLQIQPYQHEYMSASALTPEEGPPPPKALILIFVHHVSNENEDGVSTSASDCVAPPISERTASGRSKTRLGSGVSSKAKVVKEVEVGCIKSAMVKKATGEFSIDPLPSSNPHSKLFTFEPMKSSVEAGSTKTVTITFYPPKDGSTQQVYEADTNLTLKGDCTQIQRLLLRGLVCE